MVVVFLANGCEEIEALTQIDVLRRAGIDAKGVSITTEKVIKGAHGIDFMADCTIYDVDFDKVNMVVLPGGLEGRNNLMNSKETVTVCKKFNELGKIVAAICASPSVLGENGMLEGKKAVCYPGFEKQCHGACIVNNENVVRDDNIITSRGPATAMEFAVELVRAIAGDETADKTAEGLLLK
ncbi:MAG: DJ-1/PfpI family protein [Clostridia bacterium]|nr:DJ-1/PfpI family protein [Clostridia bacterium]